ncbi:hypothetical protein [Catellatospora tritici]|uniref:hypothetical protein n=1 Tax=Catellatospora tritici TaxID=2851566 RepID=UPI001C2D0E5D|nr:hypothetical protein [Catellatospora tritici]MBV1850264.1 hypothetical protein [Catellatospora tritici]
MKPSRLPVLVLGAVVLTAAVAGCKGQPTDPGPRPLSTVSAAAPPVADSVPPTEALAAASAKMKSQNVRYAMNMVGSAVSMTGKGAADVTSHSSSAVLEINATGQKLTTETLLVGDDIWLRFQGLPSLPKQWMHMKVSQLKPGSLTRRALEDPASVSAMLKSAFDVKKSGERGFEGTVDLSKSPTMTPQMLAALGDKADAVPFRVTLDDQGRVSVMTVDMSEIGKAAGVTMMKFELYEYGEPVQINPPPTADVIEMPAKLLAAL